MLSHVIYVQCHGWAEGFDFDTMCATLLQGCRGPAAMMRSTAATPAATCPRACCTRTRAPVGAAPSLPARAFCFLAVIVWSHAALHRMSAAKTLVPPAACPLGLRLRYT
jgi:hypothetical protein